LTWLFGVIAIWAFYKSFQAWHLVNRFPRC
jgi:hypothetical protein